MLSLVISLSKHSHIFISSYPHIKVQVSFFHLLSLFINRLYFNYVSFHTLRPKNNKIGQSMCFSSKDMISQKVGFLYIVFTNCF